VKRGILISAVVAAFALAACAAPVPQNASTGPTITTPAPSYPPLSQPGAAQTAVNALVAQAGTDMAIRVAITDTTASMTYVDNDNAVTLDWQNGAVTTEDSDITYVGQAIFEISSFNLSDVGAMFKKAADLTGSSNNQQLQINEYNTGRVLMTVTTSPESQTIFFRQDATVINWLQFNTTAGVAEALSDVTTGANVIDIGLNDQGLYADTTVDSSTLQRVVRPAKLPAYSALRSGSSDLTPFNPAILNASTLASLLSVTAPELAGTPNPSASWVIDMRDHLSAPTIRLTVGPTTRVYNLAGTDITDQLG